MCVATPHWMPIVTQAIQNHHALVALQNESAHIQAKKQAASYVPPVEIDVSFGQTTWGNSSGLTFDGGVRQVWVSDKKKSLYQTHWQLDWDQARLNQAQKFEELRWDLVKTVAQYLILQIQVKQLEQRRSQLSLIKQFLDSRPFLSPQGKAEAFISRLALMELDVQILHLKTQHQTSLEELACYHLTPSQLQNITFDTLNTWVQSLPASLDTHRLFAYQRLLIQKQRLDTVKSLALLDKHPDSTYFLKMNQINTTPFEQSFSLGMSVPLQFSQIPQHVSDSLAFSQLACDAQQEWIAHEFDIEQHKVTLIRSARRSLPNNIYLDKQWDAYTATFRDFQRNQVDVKTLLEWDRQLAQARQIYQEHLLASIQAVCALYRQGDFL